MPIDGEELGAVADSMFAAPLAERQARDPVPTRGSSAVQGAQAPPAGEVRGQRPPDRAGDGGSAAAAAGARAPASSRRRAWLWGPRGQVSLLRERVADWLMLAGGGLLLISLFLSWSDQLSPALRRALGGTVALRGVPASPDAWQVYSIAGDLLAMLALALVALALIGRRRARLLVGLFVALALAFVAHATARPPTNGTNLVAGELSPVRYVPNRPRAGAGEPLALTALGLALVGVLVTPGDPERPLRTGSS